MKLNLEQVELLPPEERIGETEPMGKSSFQHRPELIPLAAPSFCIYCFILVDYGQEKSRRCTHPELLLTLATTTYETTPLVLEWHKPTRPPIDLFDRHNGTQSKRLNSLLIASGLADQIIPLVVCLPLLWLQILLERAIPTSSKGN